MFPLQWGERNIGEARQVQSENAQVRQLLDEQRCPFRELQLVADEREDHANLTNVNDFRAILVQ